MDAEEAPRKQLEEVFGCQGFAAARDCLDSVSPDAVLVAGKHIEMPDHVQACVEMRIPFLIDKPFADSAARLRSSAEACIHENVFSAAILPNRASRVVGLVQRMMSEGTFGKPILCSNRLNNGPPTRYDPTPSYWQNDSTKSGGGCWAVEASHGIDTFLQFAGNSPISVVGAVMSNALHGRTVEDIGLGILRNEEGVTGIVESGYSYPSGVRAGDHFFRFIGTKASVFERYDKHGTPIIEVHTEQCIDFQEGNGHGQSRPAEIARALAAIEAGNSFAPTIGDALRILEVQDAVYAFARANPNSNGPHPLGPPPP